MSNQLFRQELNDIFSHPTDPKQLKRACKANDAWIVWENSGSVKDWKKFIALFCKV